MYKYEHFIKLDFNNFATTLHDSNHNESTEKKMNNYVRVPKL